MIPAINQILSIRFIHMSHNISEDSCMLLYHFLQVVVHIFRMATLSTGNYLVT